MEWFKNLVKHAMYRAALKDKKFVELAKQVDKTKEKYKKKVAEMEAKGEKVPDLYRSIAEGKRQIMGFVQWVFNKLLYRKLKKDKDFAKAVEKVDKSSEDLRKSIKNAQEKGIKIPDELLEYSGLKKPKKQYGTCKLFNENL